LEKEKAIIQKRQGKQYTPQKGVIVPAKCVKEGCYVYLIVG